MALLAAAKFVDDVVFRNAHYASVGGLNVKVLNGLELRFNEAANWTFFVTTDEFRAYEKKLLQRCSRTDGWD